MAVGIPYTNAREPVERSTDTRCENPPGGSRPPLAQDAGTRCSVIAGNLQTRFSSRPICARATALVNGLRPLGLLASCRIILDSSPASWAMRVKDARERKRQDGTDGDGERRHRVCAGISLGAVAELVRIPVWRSRPDRHRRRQDHRHQYRPVGRQCRRDRPCLPQSAAAPAPHRHHARRGRCRRSAHHFHADGSVPLQRRPLPQACWWAAAVLDRTQAVGGRRSRRQRQGGQRRQSLGSGEDRRHRRHRHEPRQRAGHRRCGRRGAARATHLADRHWALSSRSRWWLPARR